MAEQISINDSVPLRDKIKAAPSEPGCYLFMDKFGYIIYVGKAKNLKNRIKSYFSKAAAADERIAELVPKIVDVEYRVTVSELDALLLEFRLIKQHKPWFNSQLKPEKLRPYLRIATADPYATLSVSAQKMDDGAVYYDFFTDEEDVKATLNILCKTWGLPQCGQRSFIKKKSPCVYHTLDGCMAPCSGKPDAGHYANTIREVQRYLDGKPSGRVKALKQEMHAAADALEFEKAVSCKGLLECLQRIRHKSRRRFHLPEDGAALVLIRPFREKAFSAFCVQNGQVLVRIDYQSVPSDAMIADFVENMSSQHNVVDEDGLLASGLVEIMADKQIIVLPQGQRAMRIAAQAIRQFAK